MYIRYNIYDVKTFKGYKELSYFLECSFLGINKEKKISTKFSKLYIVSKHNMFL